MARFDLTDFEWSVIQPLLPNKPRRVLRVDDRRVLNGIFWRLRTGAPWADIPSRYGPHTTCVNRFNRWRKAGVWDYLLEAVSKAYDGDIQMIDSSSIRVHQHAANGKNWPSAEIAVMGPKGAVEIIFRGDLGDEEKIAERTEEYRKRFANPFIAGHRGYIDDVIMPHNTRLRIAKSLRMLRTKKLDNPWKKHGNIPL